MQLSYLLYTQGRHQRQYPRKTSKIFFYKIIKKFNKSITGPEKLKVQISKLVQKVIVKLEFGYFEKVKINKKVKCYSFITSKLQNVQQK